MFDEYPRHFEDYDGDGIVDHLDPDDDDGSMLGLEMSKDPTTNPISKRFPPSKSY